MLKNNILKLIKAGKSSIQINNNKKISFMSSSYRVIDVKNNYLYVLEDKNK
jgi:hypothetical protein